MTVSSMTGFARADGHEDGASWVWELKSVNSKSLDLRFRLPPGLDGLELPLRTSLAQKLKRGALSVTLTVTRGASPGGVRINREALEQVVAASQALVAEGRAALPRADGLLALRGVLESGEESEEEAERERRQAALLTTWEKALDGLVAMRRSEGARLIPVLEARLAEIAHLVAAAEDSAAVQPEALKLRLRDLVAALLDASPALPPERLAQEAALLVAKADIREEIDRLAAHVVAAQELLAEGGAIGRRFDFLCQEFNREANTLCSKSSDVALTRIGLDLKAVIEQLREQVQNLE
ncbi:MAG TPA: YicC/YloC family endoribonuclease [Stellaceae bacterium]|nr:YicC/YloC family endoribonuclease [Stellaceae bacterium]